jgi:hypothetical protein
MSSPMELKPPDHKTDRNEVHVVNVMNGHVLNMDCWCEPIGGWHTNKHGIRAFVVSHNDSEDSHLHHATIMALRTTNPDSLTVFLNSIYTFEHER